MNFVCTTKRESMMEFRPKPGGQSKAWGTGRTDPQLQLNSQALCADTKIFEADPLAPVFANHSNGIACVAKARVEV